MTPQERDLILGLFQRLTPPADGQIDGEARELIDRLGREQPLTLYLLTQTALVQEHALRGAQAHIAELEATLAPAPTAGAAPEPQHRSFLAGLFGGGSPAQPAANRPAYPPPPAPLPGPMSAGPAMTAAAPSGPSFLQSALSTAMGVAGGAFLFQGIERLLGYGGSPFAGTSWHGGSGLDGAYGRPTEQGLTNDIDLPQSEGNASGHVGNDPDFVDTTQVNDPGIDVGSDLASNDFGSGTDDNISL
jgi:uncharacterized protein